MKFLNVKLISAVLCLSLFTACEEVAELLTIDVMVGNFEGDLTDSEGGRTISRDVILDITSGTNPLDTAEFSVVAELIFEDLDPISGILLRANITDEFRVLDMDGTLDLPGDSFVYTYTGTLSLDDDKEWLDVELIIDREDEPGRPYVKNYTGRMRKME